MAKRTDITKEMVDLAVAVYFRLAYGTEPRRRRRRDDDAAHNPLEMFADETRPPEGGKESLRRYTIRLGNRNYPFMKLVLQEHIVPGEYYFTVDCHDQLDIRPDFPDYEAWMRVKRFNLELKREIEAAFLDAGLPTLGTIPRPEVRRTSTGQGPMILVVDDEEDEASALEALLRSEGYTVERAADGREALERLEFIEPALVILDYEMPELDGLAVIRELRDQDRTRDMPILLTTASQVLAKERASADGFLPKPFRSNELLELVRTLLAGA